VLNDAQLSDHRERLEGLRDELCAQLEAGRSAAGTVVLDQTKIGRLSRMDALQQQNMAQSTLRNVTARLRLVHRALARIMSGDYGYCDVCGNDIEPGRLDVQPEAPCCFACQSQQEYHPQS
jgi:DnaK suppressor protein